MLQLGVRAHDFGQTTPSESARRIATAGFSCVQLALHKALVGFEPVAGALTPQTARAVRDAYGAYGVGIAVLGCYINPVHPDPDARELGLRRFEELLRCAADFGCPVVATETGSLNPDCSFHEGTASQAVFDRLVASFRRLAVTADAVGVRIGVEGVARNHTVSTHERMTRLLDEVGSPSLGVLYDPANFLSVADAHRIEASIDDAFDRFGSRLVALHAKDCRFENGVKINDLPAGTGQIPYRALLSKLQRHAPSIPVLLEDVSAMTWKAARDSVLGNAP